MKWTLPQSIRLYQYTAETVHAPPLTDAEPCGWAQTSICLRHLKEQSEIPKKHTPPNLIFLTLHQNIFFPRYDSVSFLSALCPWNYPQSSASSFPQHLSVSSKVSLLLPVWAHMPSSVAASWLSLRKSFSLTKHHIIIFKLIQCEYFPALPITQYLEACGLALCITIAKNKIFFFFGHPQCLSQSAWLICTVALLMESSVRNWEMILEHPALLDFFLREFFPVLEFYHWKIGMQYYQPQEPYLSFFSSSPKWLKNDNF